MDFTQCYFRDRIELFMRPDYTFKITWMLDLFSWNLWSVIVLLWLFLSISGVIIHRISSRISMCNPESSIVDALFCYFGAFCNQGSELELLHGPARLWIFTINLFTFLLITSYSSLIYVIMSKSSLTEPFKDLESLYRSTDYEIFVMNKSMISRLITERDDLLLHQIVSHGRVTYFQSAESLFRAACLDHRRNAALHFRYQYATNYDHYLSCDLKPTGRRYDEKCLAALLPKGFTFKKPLNYGILRLHELGIISAVKSRWLGTRSPPGTRPYFPIELGYVYLPLMIYSSGFLLSVLLFAIEVTMTTHAKVNST